MFSVFEKSPLFFFQPLFSDIYIIPENGFVFNNFRQCLCSLPESRFSEKGKRFTGKRANAKKHNLRIRKGYVLITIHIAPDMFV